MKKTLLFLFIIGFVGIFLYQPDMHIWPVFAAGEATPATTMQETVSPTDEHREGLVNAGGHSGGHHGIDGSNLRLWWCIPFLGILLSIAIFPLILPHFWHHHYGKVSLFWGVGFLIAFSIAFGFDMGIFYLIEVYLGEFIPFIVLLLALFTVSGGVLLKGTLQGTPKVNTVLLLIGTVLASWMGTTGAAMLLIRPVLRANLWRKNKVHIIIFFIFLVANIGGSLTPLGDPPLFLGFLKGVKFFWTTTHLLPEVLLVSIILLTLFYFIDTYYYKKENTQPDDGVKEPLRLEGKVNLILYPVEREGD